MNERLCDYVNMLYSIYGKKVVDSLTELNDTAIKLKETRRIEEFIDKYERKKGEGCQNCIECFEAEFSRRKMDFPSWLNSLDFGEESAKKIMIIGEDVSPKVPKDINITYGLGRYEIRPNGKVGEEPGNRLWVYLEKLSNGKLSLITENVYMTDICKCNANKKRCIWNKCSSKFLLEEIKLINPRLVVFQGNTSYKYTKSVLNSRMKEEDISSYFECNTFPKSGKISLLKDEAHFLKIYHTSIANQKNWNKDLQGYQELTRKLLQTIIPA